MTHKVKLGQDLDSAADFSRCLTVPQGSRAPKAEQGRQVSQPYCHLTFLVMKRAVGSRCSNWIQVTFNQEKSNRSIEGAQLLDKKFWKRIQVLIGWLGLT